MHFSTQKANGIIEMNAVEDESPERFNTVINFPNFLLHVLRVRSKEDVPLDDKRLISTFETHILNSSDEAITKVKEFIFALLKCKYLFDQWKSCRPSKELQIYN